MAKQTRKCELYREAGTFGREASFIANVIFCHHRNPAKKLAGLVALLRAGHSVSLASFNIDVLQIDGAGSYPYGHLENVKAGMDFCLCGAAMQNGVCSVKGCVCSPKAAR